MCLVTCLLSKHRWNQSADVTSFLQTATKTGNFNEFDRVKRAETRWDRKTSQMILSKQIQRYCTRREVARGREIYQKSVGYTMNWIWSEIFARKYHVSEKTGEFLSKHHCEYGAGWTSRRTLRRKSRRRKAACRNWTKIPHPKPFFFFSSSRDDTNMQPGKFVFAGGHFYRRRYKPRSDSIPRNNSLPTKSRLIALRVN